VTPFAPDPLPGQPRDAGGPTFQEAWEAKAFALTLALHDKGVFSWPEWTAALSAEIAAAQASGDPDLGTTYYRHWLKALEQLIAAKTIASADAIDGVTAAWQNAARHTPHGQPVVL
jgi:nitrile hydratase accessory protein